MDTRKPKKAYQRNLKTGVFSKEILAHPNPLDHKEWIIPYGATTQEPPKPAAGRESVWNEKDGKWESRKIESQ